VYICSDAYTADLPDGQPDLDMLLVPAFQWGEPDPLCGHLRQRARGLSMIGLFANGASRLHGQDLDRMGSVLVQNDKALPHSDERAESFIVDPCRADDDGELQCIELTGSVLPHARILRRSVNLLELDVGRLREEHGRPFGQVHPLHVDQWPRDKWKENRTLLEKHREQLCAMATDRHYPGRLRDYWTMEWDTAEQVWERRRVD
jgi:hypothetical protein